MAKTTLALKRKIEKVLNGGVETVYFERNDADPSYPERQGISRKHFFISRTSDGKLLIKD
jgi:hypothetical protein